MPKTYIIQIEHNYPFQLSQINRIPATSIVKIKRSIPSTQMTKDLSSKILFSNSLRNKNLIKIESIQQTEQAVNLFYQHVESPEIPMNTEFWEALMPQLESFVQYLCNIGVKTQICEDNIGVTSKGILKYFLGLEFQLNENQNQQEFHSYFETQLQNLKVKHSIKNSNLAHYQDEKQIVPYQSHSVAVNEKYRKASLATLPSKGPTHFSLNKQLSRIKNSVKEITQFHFNGDEKQFSRSKERQQIFSGHNKIFMQQQSAFKRETSRKYSGDSQAIMMSNKKLSTKFTDFKGDIRNKSNQYSQKSIVKIQNGNGKSKVEQIKYQQYIQMSSSKKNYLKDFLSVLEDDRLSIKKNENTVLALQSPKMNSPQRNVPALQNHNLSDIQMLKFKAQQSIQNSLKIIKKVKGVC